MGVMVAITTSFLSENVWKVFILSITCMRVSSFGSSLLRLGMMCVYKSRPISLKLPHDT